MTTKKRQQIQRRSNAAQLPKEQKGGDLAALVHRLAVENATQRREINRLRAELSGRGKSYAVTYNAAGEIDWMATGVGDFIAYDFHREAIRLQTLASTTIATLHAHVQLAEGARLTDEQVLRQYIGMVADCRDQILSWAIHHNTPAQVRENIAAAFVVYSSALQHAIEGDLQPLRRALEKTPLATDDLLLVAAGIPTRGRKKEEYRRWVGEQVRELQADNASYDEIVQELRIRAGALGRSDWRSEILDRLRPWNRYSEASKQKVRAWLRDCAKLDAEK